MDGVLALQMDSLAVLCGELRTQQPGPVVQAFFESGRAQAIGGRWYVLAKGHSLTAEFDLDEVVAVQVIRGLKGKVGAEPITGARM